MANTHVNDGVATMEVDPPEDKEEPAEVDPPLARLTWHYHTMPRLPSMRPWQQTPRSTQPAPYHQASIHTRH